MRRMTTIALTSPDHPALHLLPDVPTGWQIEAFAHGLRQLEAVHGIVDISTSHHANADLYGRGITLRAGTFLVGAAHQRPGFAVCVGDITVWTEHGKQRLTGAHILQTEPGLKRIGFAHADTTWFTVHANPTGGLDLATIEAALVDDPSQLMSRRVAKELMQ